MTTRFVPSISHGDSKSVVLWLHKQFRSSIQYLDLAPRHKTISHSDASSWIRKYIIQSIGVPSHFCHTFILLFQLRFLFSVQHTLPTQDWHCDADPSSDRRKAERGNGALSSHRGSSATGRRDSEELRCPWRVLCQADTAQQAAARAGERRRVGHRAVGACQPRTRARVSTSSVLVRKGEG